MNLSIFISFILIFLGNFVNFISPLPVNPELLASHTISLENRYPEKFVNEIFRENILLNIQYLRHDILKENVPLQYEAIKPYSFELKLQPNETFALHENLLQEFEKKNVIHPAIHFTGAEGFKTDGKLYGDGVCHLASLMRWVASDAHLKVVAPTNHDFAAIPEVPKEYGTSIYFSPYDKQINAQQNLYITNTNTNTIIMKFTYDGTHLTFEIFKDSTVGVVA